jgi:transposase
MAEQTEHLGSSHASQRRLFAVPEGERMPEIPETPPPAGAPRLRRADRLQVEFRACCWNDLLPDNHEARIVWQYVTEMDLSPLLAQIKSAGDNPGHPATDPRILTALWLYATFRSVGSARELARRCDPQTGEIPFQWICGGVTLNYHTLADFRVQHVEFLDQFLTSSVAVLLQEELVTLDRVAQDGMKVRASAGAASFRRKPTLEEHLEEARQQIDALKQELQNDSAAASARQKKARQRAAREREERLHKALEQLDQLAEQKKTAEEKEKARASTTDAEARVMKMADGGYRPAYNVQLATDTQTQVITGVGVTNSGGDQGKMAPMVEQHQARYGKTPDEMLADGGYAKKEDIIAVSEPNGSTTVYAPVQVSKTSQRDAHEPRADDKPAVAEWRKRMATPEAKEIYKQRAATAECVNAIARNRGLQQFRVRGQPKVLAAMLWYVLAHNLRRTLALRAEAAQQS